MYKTSIRFSTKTIKLIQRYKSNDVRITHEINISDFWCAVENHWKIVKWFSFNGSRKVSELTSSWLSRENEGKEHSIYADVAKSKCKSEKNFIGVSPESSSDNGDLDADEIILIFCDFWVIRHVHNRTQ